MMSPSSDECRREDIYCSGSLERLLQIIIISAVPAGYISSSQCFAECFVFIRPRFEYSQLPAILIKTFSYIPESLKDEIWIFLLRNQNFFIPYLFQPIIHNNHIFCRYVTYIVKERR